MSVGKDNVCPLTMVPSELGTCWHIQDVWENIREVEESRESKAEWESWGCQGGQQMIWPVFCSMENGEHSTYALLLLMTPMCTYGSWTHPKGHWTWPTWYMDQIQTVLTLLCLLMPLKGTFLVAKASPMRSSCILLEGCLKAYIQVAFFTADQMFLKLKFPGDSFHHP